MKISDTYRNRGRFLGWGSSPKADWKVMLSVFLILIILIAGASTKLLLSLLSDNRGAESDTTPPLDVDALHKAALYYDKQTTDFETVKKTPETTPDPSL